MVRAFIGIALPVVVRQTLVRCREAYLDEDPAWRHEKWVAEENLHVTLRFLGGVEEEALTAVAHALKGELAGVGRFRVRLASARAVPRPRAASLIWVDASTGSEQAAGLAAAIGGALEPIGFERDTRPFKTHVTLCRARAMRRVATPGLDAIDRVLAMAEERETTVSVREVTLYSSTLTPRGPIYEEVAIVPLGE